MISVQEALGLIKSNTTLLPTLKLPLTQAPGLVLAEDVFARCSVPNFDQAAMDGYALRYDTFLKTKEFHVANELAAGEKVKGRMADGDAARIFTGAAVPQGLDTVVMQEKVEQKGDNITVLDAELTKGRNIRLEGTEIRKGNLALKKGTCLSPAAVGFLASVGIIEVLVYPKPLVHIIITGKELIKPGQELQHGKVYESNSLLLFSALKQLHIDNITIDVIDDDLDKTAKMISKVLGKADLILLTGGVSTGEYDFVVKAAGACDVQQLFHKVKQRPGKPLYAGTRSNRVIFGLPGNPAAALVCFYNYVVVAIECMTGRQNLIPKKQLPLATAFTKKVKLTQFLKASCDDKQVTPLPAQESFRLSSFSVANCLIILPEEKLDFAEGEMVETLLLPYL